MSDSIQYGPWHDVKPAWETRWVATARYAERKHDVVHPAECGWVDGYCDFEDVLNDSNEPGTGNYRARVVATTTTRVGTDYAEYELEWEPVGGAS